MKTILLIISLIAGLSCYTHAGDFTVQLISPPHKILKDEYWAEFKVVLSNGTASAIRIYEMPGSAYNWQVFFALTNKEHMDYCLRRDDLREARPKNTWESLSTNSVNYKTRLLNPGETHTWNFADIFCPLGSFIPDYLDIRKFGVAHSRAGVNREVSTGPTRVACGFLFHCLCSV